MTASQIGGSCWQTTDTMNKPIGPTSELTSILASQTLSQGLSGDVLSNRKPVLLVRRRKEERGRDSNCRFIVNQFCGLSWWMISGS